MMQAAVVFITQGLYVFLLGFQSRNVRDNQFVWAAATSTLLGCCGLVNSVVVIRATIAAQWLPLFAFVMAGPVGICAAMFIHNRIRREK